MAEARVVPSNETPLRDDERATYDLDRLSSQAHLLHDRLETLGPEKRKMEYLGEDFTRRQIPDLMDAHPQLAEMIVKNPAAIQMCDRMFLLMRLRQEGSISGFDQDKEFGRLVAKSHLPGFYHAEIDKKVDETKM